jgi:hypothetical protein
MQLHLLLAIMSLCSSNLKTVIKSYVLQALVTSVEGDSSGVEGSQKQGEKLEVSSPINE